MSDTTILLAAGWISAGAFAALAIDAGHRARRWKRWSGFWSDRAIDLSLERDRQTARISEQNSRAARIGNAKQAEQRRAKQAETTARLAEGR